MTWRAAAAIAAAAALLRRAPTMLQEPHAWKR
jgi:hypothetical protein